MAFWKVVPAHEAPAAAERYIVQPGAEKYVQGMAEAVNCNTSGHDRATLRALELAGVITRVGDDSSEPDIYVHGIG